MALLYRAELRPFKIELIESWAPAQPWFERGPGAGFVTVGAFRFDDPEGEVGIETLLVRAGDGPVLQVPLTYRGAPLEGGEAALLGTMQHSVLGERWVYDGAGDPAYLTALAAAVLTGGSQAELYVETDGGRVRRDPTAVVRGSGTGGAQVPPLVPAAGVSRRPEPRATAVAAGDLRAVILRVLPDDGQDATVPSALDAVDDLASEVLTGAWSGQPEPRLLARVLRP